MSINMLKTYSNWNIANFNITQFQIAEGFIVQNSVFKFQFLLFATSVQNAQCVNGSFQNIFNWEERLHMFQKLDYLLL